MTTSFPSSPSSQGKAAVNKGEETPKPRILLVVGRIAAQTLLASELPIGKLRGQVHRYGAASTPLVATYHPAYLLRAPGEKRKAWEDLKLARRVFDDATGAV